MSEPSFATVATSSIHPNDYNPNRQSREKAELLRLSIIEDGFTQPIVALRCGTIVDGEHRWRAARALGMESVPVVWVEMTDQQRKKATVRHNRARGHEDLAATQELMAELEELGAVEAAIEGLQLAPDEIAKHFGKEAAPPKKPPPKPKATRPKRLDSPAGPPVERTDHRVLAYFTTTEEADAVEAWVASFPSPIEALRSIMQEEPKVG